MANPAANIREVSVTEFASRLATAKELPQKLPQEDLQLVDVREPDELAVVQLPGFINLPLRQSQQWAGQIDQYLDRDKDTYVLCHHGVRSAQMCYWLIQQGFTKVNNISGGIDAYAVEVDRSLPRY
jgi:rhodanese-related sulfurtransferase